MSVCRREGERKGEGVITELAREHCLTNNLCYHRAPRGEFPLSSYKMHFILIEFILYLYNSFYTYIMQTIRWSPGECLIHLLV